MTTSELFKDHVDELYRRAQAGDDFAWKSLCCIAMVSQGWRYGDPDPDDGGPDDDGCEVIDLRGILLRRAA